MKSQDSPLAPVSFWKLYQFSTKLDYALILVGGLCAVGMGIIQPLLFYWVGDIYVDLKPMDLQESYYNNTVQVCYLLLIFGSVYTVLAYVAVMTLVTVGSRQSNHYRREYMAAVLRQDPEWFDRRAVAELPNALTSDTVKIERATGDKLVMVIFTSIMVIAALVIAIIQGLQLTLIACAFGPFEVGGLMLGNRTMERTAYVNDLAYKKAGGIAEEALTEIKTVSAHNAQPAVFSKYSSSLSTSYTEMLKSGLKLGFGFGIAMSGFMGSMAALMVTTATLIRDERSNWVSSDNVDTGKALMTMMVCMMSFHNIATLAPCLKIIMEGKVAGSTVLQVLAQPNTIQSGTYAGELKGAVQFSNVDFAYPSAPQKWILRQFSCSTEPGDTLAILGETGSGKSTVVSLLMRFYDCGSGEILVDGVNIKDWDLKAFRAQIGLVSQEPILFNASIGDNIRYGKPSAFIEEIEEAARKAEVYDTVDQFTQRFETMVGSKGSQLSGGERQRVAIARAIIRSPKLLLLDESTSALDKNTEASVQLTLNTLMANCTTIMIAHRISTIRKATKVIVVAQGEVAEMGTQEELIAKQGKFYHTLMMQSIEIAGNKSESASAASTISYRRKTLRTEIATEEIEIVKKPNYTSRILKMTSGTVKWLIFGVIGSVICGVANPFNGWILGLELDVLINSTGARLESDTRFYGGMLGASAIGLFLGMMLQATSFPLVGARVTLTMRQESFKALLNYDLSFFDSNNATVLATQLNSDCEKVNGLGGSILGFVMGVVASMIASAAVSGSYSWRIMLIVMGVFPIYAMCILSSFLSQHKGLVSYSYEDATVYASDCILNYKTVKSLGLEQHLLDNYMKVVEKVSQVTRKRGHYAGFTFGLGYGLLYYLYALMFWFAAKLLKDDIVDFKSMNISLFAGLLGTTSILMSGLFAPDIKQGQVAAQSIFSILDYESTIDPNSENGDKEGITGTIRFDDVSFKYPSRDQCSLSNVSFDIPAGSTFAIVGTTGSGKSTIIQLLLRFYDASEGSVKFDGKDIKDFNIRHLRSQIAIVGQEPVLFTGSITSNIAYGIEVSEEQVHKAAEQAQALSFILNHPDGFSREVGLRGSRLSGGEKQRIAIARAIIRKPKLLILDEATSALDSDTEAKLTDILGGLIQGRTTVVVAHRIKTVSTMDQIAVLSNGELLELGSFNELMEKKGFLYSLAMQR